MTDRPIIFSAPMVRALLDGRKTQTRRVLGKARKHAAGLNIFDGTWADSYVLDPGNADWRERCTPYGVGDKLWVRETFRTDDAIKRYRASGHVSPFGWKSPIHMPRSVSRLTLVVTDVRVQRLQEISVEDAIAEGLEWVAPTWGVRGLADSWNGDPVQSYCALWDRLHGPGAWDANPWVCALTFSVHLTNIDAMEHQP